MEPVVWCRSWGVGHTLPAVGLESSWEGNKIACNKTHTTQYWSLRPLHEKGHCQCVQGFSYMNSVIASRSISQARSKTTNHIEKAKFWKHLELDRETHFPSVSWTATILEHCPPQLGQWCTHKALCKPAHNPALVVMVQLCYSMLYSWCWIDLMNAYYSKSILQEREGSF